MAVRSRVRYVRAAALLQAGRTPTGRSAIAPAPGDSIYPPPPVLWVWPLRVPLLAFPVPVLDSAGHGRLCGLANNHLACYVPPSNVTPFLCT